MRALNLLITLSLAFSPAAGPQSATTPSAQTTTPTEHPQAAQYTLEPITTQNAEYPAKARKKKLEGQVAAGFFVLESGDVGHVYVTGTRYGVELLLAVQDAVRDAVSKWKFKPVVKDGSPIQVYGRATFVFALKDESERTNGVPGEIKGAIDVSKFERVRVSSGVIQSLLVHKVAPVYPEEAKSAHIKGNVLLQARIDKEGKVADAQLISGPKELAQAAIDAVQQWRYRPYLLDGEPVEVDTQIQVNFDRH
jgi:TonB family protein